MLGLRVSHKLKGCHIEPGCVTFGWLDQSRSWWEKGKSRDFTYILFALYLKNGSADFDKNSTIGKPEVESIGGYSQMYKKAVLMFNQKV